MRGIRTFIASFAFAAGVAAAAPDYFPLAPGNQWIYRAGAQTMTIEVARAEGAYYVVRGFPAAGEVKLRMDDGGTLYSLDASGAREAVWAAFSAPEGAEYDTVIEPCTRRARIASTAARYTGPVGQFDTALRIVYPPSGCADAGITEEIYLPYVGLARRTVTTIAGPVTYELIYAQLGGVTIITGPGVSFGVTLDRALYYVNLMPPVDPLRAAPEMTARLTLRNWTDTPLALTFPSGQSYDLVLRNAKDEVVYRWSDGKAFTMIFRNETLPPRQERNYVVVVRLADKTGKPLSADRYTAEAWFTSYPADKWFTTEGGKRYAATVGFEIQNIY